MKSHRWTTTGICERFKGLSYSGQDGAEDEEEHDSEKGTSWNRYNPGYKDCRNDPEIDCIDSTGEANAEYGANQCMGCGNRHSGARRDNDC